MSEYRDHQSPSHAAAVLLRTPPRSRSLAVFASVAAVAVATLLIYPLRTVAPPNSMGVVYLVAVLLVSTFWGLRLGLLTALLSAIAFGYFHLSATFNTAVDNGEDAVSLVMFVIVAAITSSIAQLARSRAVEAEERRREAACLADTARLLLGDARVDDALPGAGKDVAAALDLPWAEILLDVEEATASPGIVFTLQVGANRSAALVVPDETLPAVLERTRARLAPALEQLLGVALERDRLQSEVVEAQREAGRIRLREVRASRARVLAAADEERRRVVRDLHDGAQQRLVHTVITLKLARRALEHDDATVGTLVGEALDQAQKANVELRDLSHGILPSVLTRGGLRAGVDSLVSRMPVPVSVAITGERLPSAIEATAYFVVAEALTNVAKHSRARSAEVSASIEEDMLRVEIRDDGIGGVKPDGSGLLGLGDRLSALDGRLRVESPPSGGTVIAATIPVPR